MEALAVRANQYPGRLALLLCLLDFVTHLSSPSFSWQSAQAMHYHCSEEADGKLLDWDILSSLSPLPSPLFFSLPLLLHWELLFLHQSLPSPYPHTHICTENLRHFKQTCFNVIMPCYTLKNFSFQSERRYSAGLPCSVTVQIKLGFILKLLLQSVHNQRLLFE